MKIDNVVWEKIGSNMVNIYLHKMLCWNCKKDLICKLYQTIGREQIFSDYLSNMFKLNSISLSISIKECNEFEQTLETNQIKKIDKHWNQKPILREPPKEMHLKEVFD